ncbi:DUF763 domain-containing protein [candidate division KSB1 bacterium]|nr:MAG: DUF763 domain-containing protein [candidate division KSB1 bacterium]
MGRTGIAHLPLHGGKAPRWLFNRMTRLGREIVITIVSEFGPAELLRRLSDPFWFQALGCVLGFDWHSSGVTTTVCGALKEGTKGLEKELGVIFAGGKGGISRRTPEEILKAAERFGFDPAPLIYASRMAAKVDNNALQDGYQLYHHTFVFTHKGEWSVIQQGMNEINSMARRYHWLGEKVEKFVVEPHAAICAEQKTAPLNLVARESEANRQASTALGREKPETLLKELRRIQQLELPRRHPVQIEDINPQRLEKIFLKIYERQPADFETLLGLSGVGPKTIRALSLIAELIYGAEPSFRDPARFSFAHGGKDGHPYPVDRANYDRSIMILERAIKQAKLGQREQLEALRRLSQWL